MNKEEMTNLGYNWDDVYDEYEKAKQELSKEKEIKNKIREKLNDYTSILNKGFPYDKLLVIKNDLFDDKFLELSDVLKDFLSLLGDE